MHLSYVLYGLLGLIIARVALFIFQSLISPLRSVPGPFSARLSRLYYFRRVAKGRFEHDNIDLHRQYGPIVRVAPDMYSIDSPDVVKSVYGIGTKFAKSDWYEGWKHPSPDRWTLFPDRDMKRHAETRKRFQALYSMSSLVSYEGYVDDCTKIFSERLTEFVKTGEVIDMGHWFQCYAFDVIGNITYSERFGFLDGGKDIDGIIAALHNSMQYSSLVGLYPALHPVLFNPMSKLKASGAGGRLKIMNFVQRQLDRRNAAEEDMEKLAEKDETAPQDFLEKLLLANKKDPEKTTKYHVYMMGLSNIIAGSDTTAVSLSATLYYLLKNPKSMTKLRQEIQTLGDEGRCSTPNVTFAESQDMPYLQAVIKEAMRLHPATGLPLWRVVPEGGAEICGRYFPVGTVIGLNTWVAHYNENVFPDAKAFRPERWLEAEKEGGERIKEMDNYYLPFGLGSRTCLGRHISFLEMSKLIPKMVREFDFELENPKQDWTTTNYWFVVPNDFQVRVKHRKS